MRRFIGFILLAISILIGVSFSTPGMMKDANLSLDFTSGKEFVYTVENYDDTLVVDDSEMNELVNDLSERLDNAGVNRYELLIEGNDQIRVRVTEDYAERYEHIKKLMSFSSTFTLTTSDGLFTADADQIFENSVARIEFNGPEAYFVIPVSSTDILESTLIPEAKKLNTSTEDSVSDEGKLLLWSDFQEGDSLSEANKEENKDMAERILCMFDPDNLYFDADAKNKAISLKITDYSADSNINAYSLNADKANMLVDLFNAKKIDLKLTFLFEDYVNPLAEGFVSYGKPNLLNPTRTLLALGIGLILVTIFMLLFYRLQGFNAVINLVVTLFVTFAIFNTVGMIFNATAIIGIVVVTLLSLASSIIYIEHFKNEVYRGRTLKKANSEAHKKSFVAVIDTHVLVLVLGLLTYFIGNVSLASLGVAAIIGSIISFVVNVSLHRLMTWLITNDTSSQNKYKRFSINPELVPNLSDEEKQKYYGPFANTDFTKKSKRNGIGTLVATGVFILAMIGFGVFGNGVVNNNNGSEFTRAYYEIHEYGPNDNNDVLSIEGLKTKLDIQEFKDANISVDEVKMYETMDDIGQTINYYVVDFNGKIDETTTITINNVEMTVNDYLTSLITIDASETDSMTIRQVRQNGMNPSIKNNQRALENILLVTSILIVVSTIYMIIRFGLARGLTSLITSILSTFLPLGFFALTRIATTSTTFASLVAIAIINSIITIMIGSKAKEVLDDHRNDEVSIIDNNKNALSLAAMGIIVFEIIAGFLSVNFFGFGHPAFMTIFAVLLLGVAVMAMLNLNLFVPIQMFFIKKFGDVNIHLPRIKKANKQTKSGNINGGHKSAEPEEALFPGIND